MQKRKNHSSIPRHKRLSRDGRLYAAKHWLPNYNGKNTINVYSKHFGVNAICAVVELEMLGFKFDPDNVKQLRQNEENRCKEKVRRRDIKRQQDLQNLYSDSDDDFYFIVGYTSGGAPFGVTWEELGTELFDWPDYEDS